VLSNNLSQRLEWGEAQLSARAHALMAKGFARHAFAWPRAQLSDLHLRWAREELRGETERRRRAPPALRVRLARGEGRDVTAQYGGKDETCSVSTGGKGGGAGGSTPPTRPPLRKR